MKLSRRLIPAIAMLMVSAVLMSTASFAWFSMNTQVTATGLQVTAKAPSASLLISQDDDTGFGSTIALANESVDMTADSKINPVTDDNTHKEFFELTPAGMALVNEAGKLVAPAGGNLPAVVDNEWYDVATTTDVYKDTFYLKLDDASGASKKIRLTAAYNGVTDTAIKSAFHIIVFVNGVYVDEMDMGDATIEIAELCTLSGGEGVRATEITIYAFLDGNDDQCMNANMSTEFTAKIDLTFDFVE